MIRLFTAGFPPRTTTSDLHLLFADFGDVSFVKMITDERTGRSKGYAFVDLLDETGAKLAIKDLNNSRYTGRLLAVRLAERQPNSITPAIDKIKRPRLKVDRGEQKITTGICHRSPVF